MHLHPYLAEQLAQARRLDLQRMSTRQRLAHVARRRSRTPQLLPALVKSRMATPSITRA